MAGELFIIIEKTGGGTVNNADHHLLPDNLSESGRIIFEASEEPNGGIDNTGNAFPDGMTNSSVD